jgi:hypothetical protein
MNQEINCVGEIKNTTVLNLQVIQKEDETDDSIDAVVARAKIAIAVVQKYDLLTFSCPILTKQILMRKRTKKQPNPMHYWATYWYHPAQLT